MIHVHGDIKLGGIKMNKEKIANENKVPATTETIEEITGQDIVNEEQEQTKTGVVFNCFAVYVRSTPDFNHVNIATTISKGTEVTINKSESTDEFYKVTTPTGILGFCKKEYIKIN